ncbi:MAG TPA: DUF3300 domain-containing protein [Terriglobia bacterium]|nr:DUF3300 domain-containing protein [Terriglobia bacterium]
MKTNLPRSGGLKRLGRQWLSIVCALLLAPGEVIYLSAQPARQGAESSATIPPEQLDALVAPIALYPDPLLSQTLVASTYPLEIMQLQQWLERNKGLQGQALVDAVSTQPWDPSIQAMAALPDVVKRLADDIQWTTDLGNAFLAQQGDVMDAVQRMRVKAEDTGALASNDKQTVANQVIDNRSVVVIEQANPEVVYVPSYNPEAVYGPAVYPYPPIYYPSYSPGAVWAASAISFGAGVVLGAAWGGGWGWRPGWGHNDININRVNHFNRNTNINVGNRGEWRHNPQHRGGAPYPDRVTANRFGSNARGETLANRQRSAQQQINRQKGNLGSVTRPNISQRPGPAHPSLVNRPTTRPSAGNRPATRPGPGNRPTTRPNVGNRPATQPGLANRPTTRPNVAHQGGANRIGNHNLGNASPRGSYGGFNAGSRGYNGNAARVSSHRGASSFGGSQRSFGGGGGVSRGGGGRSRGGGRR